MTITIDRDANGRDVVTFVMRTDRPVVTIRQLAKHRDGTVLEEDLDARNEVLGLALTGKVKIIDKRAAVKNGHAQEVKHER